MFRVIRKTIREVRRAAHLWPPMFKGRSSCLVNWPISCPSKVRSRLFSQRSEGVGNSNQGRISARAISGTPKKTGDSN